MVGNINCPSSIISSQLPPDKWYETVRDPTIADAIIDRIVHNSYKIELDVSKKEDKNN